MKDELTELMHSEFSIEPETETKHKAGCVWHLASRNTSITEIRKLAASYGILFKQVMSYREYWLSIHEKDEVAKENAVCIKFSCSAYNQCPSLYIYINFVDGINFCKAYLGDEDKYKIETSLPDHLVKMFAKDNLPKICKTKKNRKNNDGWEYSHNDYYSFEIHCGDINKKVDGYMSEMKNFRQYFDTLGEFAYECKDRIYRRIRIREMKEGKVSENEPFLSQSEDLSFDLKDFWMYQYSNVWFQTGELAEFIVYKALNGSINMNRDFWAVYDLKYKDWRIEVKSTADNHAWNKEGKQTQRVFDIHKVKNRGFVKNDEKYCRVSDLYVFCHNRSKNDFENDPEGSFPLNLDNWEFYVLPTSVINDICGNQKTLSLGRLKKIHSHAPCHFMEIKGVVDDIINNLENNEG